MAATLFRASEARTTAIGLLFWIAFGAIFVRRYDKQGRDRMDPKLLAYVHQVADDHRDPRSSQLMMRGAGPRDGSRRWGEEGDARWRVGRSLS